MKKYQLAFLSLFIVFSAFAQQDTTTVFQSPRGYFVDPIRANFKKIVTQKDSLWEVSLYGRKNVLEERINFEDKNLTIRKGDYLFNENGKIKQQGYYNRGYKVGEWINYYPNGEVKEKAHYKWDLLDGEFTSYWSNGQLKKQGTYLLGRRIKDWAMFYENNQPALKESYDESGKLIHSTYFAVNGEQTPVPNTYVAPSYPSGIQSFYNLLFKQIKNTKSNAVYATYGTIRLEFMVNQDGSVADIIINGSTDEYLNKELIRVVKLAGKWISAKELGDPIRARHVIPIKFFSN